MAESPHTREAEVRVHLKLVEEEANLLSRRIVELEVRLNTIFFLDISLRLLAQLGCLSYEPGKYHTSQVNLQYCAKALDTIETFKKESENALKNEEMKLLHSLVYLLPDPPGGEPRPEC